MFFSFPFTEKENIHHFHVIYVDIHDIKVDFKSINLYRFVPHFIGSQSYMNKHTKLEFGFYFWWKIYLPEDIIRTVEVRKFWKIKIIIWEKKVSAKPVINHLLICSPSVVRVKKKNSNSHNLNLSPVQWSFIKDVCVNLFPFSRFRQQRVCTFEFCVLHFFSGCASPSMLGRVNGHYPHCVYVCVCVCE